jgi:predicted amidophosphoribosyltransferase
MAFGQGVYYGLLSKKLVLLATSTYKFDLGGRLKRIIAMLALVGLVLILMRKSHAQHGCCRKCGSLIQSDPHEWYAYCPRCMKYI